MGEYVQEYVFMLEIDGEEMKIRRVEEFVDSKFDAEFRSKLATYMSSKN